MLAHLVEEVLLPICDAAIDLHSGGKAAWFTPCSMAGRLADGSHSQCEPGLAEAFGAPLVLGDGRFERESVRKCSRLSQRRHDDCGRAGRRWCGVSQGHWRSPNEAF